MPAEDDPARRRSRHESRMRPITTTPTLTANVATKASAPSFSRRPPAAEESSASASQVPPCRARRASRDVAGSWPDQHLTPPRDQGRRTDDEVVAGATGVL